MKRWKAPILKNLFFIIIIIGMLVCYERRYHYLDANVAPRDMQILFSTEQETVKQTWSPHVKWVENIAIPYMTTEDFKGKLKFTFLNNITGKEIFSETVCLDCKGEVSDSIYVDFGHQKMDLTMQYAFQLTYEEVEVGNGIFLFAGENYDGGSIDGENLNAGIAIDVLFTKYSTVFFMMLILFIIYSLSVCGMLLWNRRFEETAGQSVLFVGLLLYLFGLAGLLETGIYAVLVLAIVSFIAVIIIYNRKDLSLKELFCPSMVLFAVIFAVLLVYNRGIWYTRPDEYIHWGTAIKDMYYFNSLPRHLHTTIAAADYPPFATLIEYFFTYWNGLFSEPMTYVGYQVAVITMMMACWKTERKYSLYTVLAVIATILVPIMFINDSYCTVYADCLLGVEITYLLVCWFQERNTAFNLLRMGMGLAALVLTKRYGIFFALIFLGIVMLDFFLEQCRKRRLSIKEWFYSAMLIAVIGGAYLSFHYYSSTSVEEPVRAVAEASESEQEALPTVKEEQKSDLGFDLYRAISGTGFDDNQAQLIRQFLSDLWIEGTWRLGIYDASYMGVTLALFLSSFFAWLALRKAGYKTGILKSSLLITLGSLMYGMVMIMSRVKLYNQFAGTVVDSHERYMGSYAIAMTIATIAMLLWEIQRIEVQECNGGWNSKGKIVLVLMLVGVIIISTPLGFFVTKNTGRGFNSEYMFPFGDIERMTQSTAKIGDRVYYITNSGIGGNRHVFAGTVSPWLTVSIRGNDGMCASREIFRSWAKEEDLGDIEKIRYVSAQDFAEELTDYQYLFIMKSEQYFIESFGELFEDPDSIENGTYYKVEYDERGKIKLRLIGKVGVLIC
ncbi:MAG: hypothetical protein K2N15_14195 [Lachnospiraceae bacterium]|nr:hypothetical protein [Lachnospiraceae bacterium]